MNKRRFVALVSVVLLAVPVFAGPVAFRPASVSLAGPRLRAIPQLGPSFVARPFAAPSASAARLTPSPVAAAAASPRFDVHAAVAPEAVRIGAVATELAAPADPPAVSITPVHFEPDPVADFGMRAMALFAGHALAPGETLGVAYKTAPAAVEGAIPGDDELTSRVARSPLTNAERMNALIELFRAGGATDADIVLQDAGRGSSNVIVTKRGRSDRVIVVGAHYDKVHEGRGVIDNWTGASLVANLHQALHGVDTEATIVFIAFAREEEGLIGSSQYVRSLSREQRAKIDAMVNLDTLAVDGTFAWQGNSTQVLVDRIVQVAAETNHPAQAARLTGGDADSSTFRRAGIPAVTVFGASQGVIFDIIHSENDNMAAFNFVHYKNAYLLIIEVLKSLDRQPLGADGRRRV